jgi:hypothetical protein
MQKLALALAVATLTSGCATVANVPLDNNVSAALKDQTITQTSRSKPDFAAMTAGKVMFGALGALAMVSAGNDIIRGHNVPDPADAIALALLDNLQTARGARVVGPAISVASGDAEVVGAAGQGRAKYILDVQTTGWSFGYFPTDWTHYRVMHFAIARLIDTGNNKVIAQGTCKHLPETNQNAPTYDELVGGSADGLKKALRGITDDCVKTLKRDMLAI